MNFFFLNLFLLGVCFIGRRGSRKGNKFAAPLKGKQAAGMCLLDGQIINNKGLVCLIKWWEEIKRG